MPIETNQDLSDSEIQAMIEGKLLYWCRTDDMEQEFANYEYNTRFDDHDPLGKKCTTYRDFCLRRIAVKLWQQDRKPISIQEFRAALAQGIDPKCIDAFVEIEEDEEVFYPLDAKEFIELTKNSDLPFLFSMPHAPPNTKESCATTSTIDSECVTDEWNSATGLEVEVDFCR